MQPGTRNLITDVAGLRVGNASDAAVKTGATVLVGDTPFIAGIHIMGGAPGTRESDLLAPDKLVQEVDALVLSGGSAFGLDASSGVADAMRKAGRGFDVGGQKVPIVPGAILFDLLNGGAKDWAENPYKVLGQQAYAACGKTFELGTHGAGTGATLADLKGGLGSASLVLENGITVGALVAVNAVGGVTMGDRGHFWAAPWEFAGEFQPEFGGMGMGDGFDPTQEPTTKLGPNQEPTTKLGPNQATTIAIVATDATLTQAQATRMAIAAHDGMARAIHPSHTPFDGDLVFGAATSKIPLKNPDRDLLFLGHAAAICVSRAIARGVYEAQTAPNDPLPTWKQKYAPR